MNNGWLSHFFSLCQGKSRLAVILSFVFFAPHPLFAYPDARMHKADLVEVFDNLDGAALDAFEELSKSIDNDIAKSFRSQFGSIPGNHRIIGHGWSLDGTIPQDTLALLEKHMQNNNIPAGKKELLDWWRKIAKKYVNDIVKATGLPENQAKALGSIVWDIHLLGDLVPEYNTLVENVLASSGIVKNLESNLKLLFKGRPALTDDLIKALHEALRKSDDVQVQAKELLAVLKSSTLGSKLMDTYGKTLGKNGSYRLNSPAPLHFFDRVAYFFKKNHNLVKEFQSELHCAKAAQPGGQILPDDISASAPGCSKAMTNQAKDALRKYHLQHPPKGVTDVKTTTGYLQKGTLKNGKHAFFLTISEDAIKAGKAAGIMTFVISEGMTTYAFLAGDITETDFCWETAKNGAAAIATGAATLVAVSLGAGPAGPVVIAIGIGTYIVCDIAFSRLRRFSEGVDLTEDDLLGLLPEDIRGKVSGITYDGFDSILDYSGKVGALDFSDDLAPGPLDGAPNHNSPLDPWDNMQPSALEWSK